VRCDIWKDIENRCVYPDPGIVEALKPWKEEVDALASKVIGKTRVPLENKCRYKECNLGNLVTDAMVDAVRGMFSTAFCISDYKICEL
jgi:5'-nucleotidase